MSLDCQKLSTGLVLEHVVDDDTKPLTVSFWFKRPVVLPVPVPGFEIMLQHGLSDDTDRRCWRSQILYHETWKSLIISRWSEGALRRARFNCAWIPGLWTNVLCTMSGPLITCSVLGSAILGSAYGDLTGFSVPHLDNERLVVSGSPKQAVACPVGLLAEVVFWNRLLSTQEARDLRRIGYASSMCDEVLSVHSFTSGKESLVEEKFLVLDHPEVRHGE